MGIKIMTVEVPPMPYTERLKDMAAEHFRNYPHGRPRRRCY